MSEPDKKGEWSIGEGWDGGILINEDYWEEDALTKQEQIELANYMINLWKRFKWCVERKI